jgi:hypothetical protein
LSDLTQELLETVATDVDMAMSRIDEIGVDAISLGGTGVEGINVEGINAVAPTSQGGRRRPGAMRA